MWSEHWDFLENSLLLLLATSILESFMYEPRIWWWQLFMLESKDKECTVYLIHV